MTCHTRSCDVTADQWFAVDLSAAVVDYYILVSLKTETRE
jgi:hypothetical protein